MSDIEELKDLDVSEYELCEAVRLTRPPWQSIREDQKMIADETEQKSAKINSLRGDIGHPPLKDLDEEHDAGLKRMEEMELSKHETIYKRGTIAGEVSATESILTVLNITAENLWKAGKGNDSKTAVAIYLRDNLIPALQHTLSEMQNKQKEIDPEGRGFKEL
jgi:hypothetical protein